MKIKITDVTRRQLATMDLGVSHADALTDYFLDLTPARWNLGRAKRGPVVVPAADLGDFRALLAKAVGLVSSGAWGDARSSAQILRQLTKVSAGLA